MRLQTSFAIRQDLLTERRLRDMLALRRIREATLLRDSDKEPELMNLHLVIFRWRWFLSKYRLTDSRNIARIEHLEGK